MEDLVLIFKVVFNLVVSLKKVKKIESSSSTPTWVDF